MRSVSAFLFRKGKGHAKLSRMRKSAGWQQDASDRRLELAFNGPIRR
jgi:hypothetical protein